MSDWPFASSQGIFDKTAPAPLPSFIGSSVSANWNTSHIDAFKMYNESLDGGNIVEEKTISDRALASSRIKLVIVVVHPFLTSSHDFEAVHVTPRENLDPVTTRFERNAIDRLFQLDSRR